ncbi:hypothetical protein ACJBU6_09328 [Exserohilum turcicum]
MGPTPHHVEGAAGSDGGRLNRTLGNGPNPPAANMATRGGDVDMADAPVEARDADDHASVLQTNYSDAFAFSDSERLALQLYDQLYELELQQSLVGAQQSGTFCMSNRFMQIGD